MTARIAIEKPELTLREKFERLQKAFRELFSGDFKFYFYRKEEGETKEKKPRVAVCIACDAENAVYHRGISVCVPPDNPERLYGKYKALQRLYRAIKQEKDKVVHISPTAQEVIGIVVGDGAASNLHPIIFRSEWDLTKGFEDTNFYAFGCFKTQPTEYEKELLVRKKTKVTG